MVFRAVKCIRHSWLAILNSRSIRRVDTATRERFFISRARVASARPTFSPRAENLFSAPTWKYLSRDGINTAKGLTLGTESSRHRGRRGGEGGERPYYTNVLYIYTLMRRERASRRGAARPLATAISRERFKIKTGIFHSADPFAISTSSRPHLSRALARDTDLNWYFHLVSESR